MSTKANFKVRIDACECDTAGGLYKTSNINEPARGANSDGGVLSARGNPLDKNEWVLPLTKSASHALSYLEVAKMQQLKAMHRCHFVILHTWQGRHRTAQVSPFQCVSSVPNEQS